MYPISPAFQKVLNSRTGRNRSIVWWGELILTNGKTHPLTPAPLPQCTGHLTTSCELPGVGGVYATELQAQIVIPVEPQMLKGAKIGLFVRLTSFDTVTTWADAENFSWSDLESLMWGDTSNTIYTDIPMGVFNVTDAKRAINSIRIEAYDNMGKFDTDLPRMDSKARTPFDWMRLMCNTCGVELGMTKNEVRALTNGSRNFTYADINSNVKTCRDLLSQLAAAMCCIAVADREGRLVFTQIRAEAVAKLTPDDRFSSEYSDVQHYYTGITAQYKAKALQEYYKNCGTLDDDGLIIDLGSNSFLQISNDSNRAAAVQAIIDTFKGVTFTPFDASIPFNPAYDLLDVLAFSGGHAPANSHGPITSITRQIGGAMTIQCATPETQSNPTRETVQIDGLSGAGSMSGKVYASSDFWIVVGAFPTEETIIGDDTVTTELTVNCTVDNTCTQIAWTGAYTLDEAATVTVKILVDGEEIYKVSDDQAAGNHVLNVTTGHNINTQGEHVVKVILREDVL